MSAIFAVMALFVVVFAGCAQKNQEAMEKDAGAQKQDNGGLVLKEFDLNADGIIDVFKYYSFDVNPDSGKKEYVLQKRELDLNGDGKVDVWTEYQASEIKKESFDLDFDGRVDLVDQYAKGVVIKKEIDFQFDQRPDIFKYYLKGQLVRKERDRNNDGRIDYWEYYENEKIDRIGIDHDGDGKVDSWRQANPQQKEGEAAPASDQEAEESKPAEKPEELPVD